jgi:hypothetical protein
MTEESFDLKAAARRSGLAVMLRRTTFNVVLRGCTITDLQAAIPSATVPRQFTVKVRDGVLILRKFGGPQPLATGWAVKARMEETVDGVRLTGHQCYLSDRLYFAFLATFSVSLVGVAAWIASNEGLGSAGVTGCLAVATLPGLLALLVVALQPRAVAKQDERSKQIIRRILAEAN